LVLANKLIAQRSRAWSGRRARNVRNTSSSTAALCSRSAGN